MPPHGSIQNVKLRPRKGKRPLIPRGSSPYAPSIDTVSVLPARTTTPDQLVSLIYVTTSSHGQANRTLAEGVSTGADTSSHMAFVFFLLLSPLYRWGNGGPEKVSGLPKAIARKIQSQDLNPELAPALTHHSGTF